MPKAIVTIIAGVVIAAGAYFTGSATDIGQAIAIAFNKDAAKAECIKLIEGEETDTE